MITSAELSPGGSSEFFKPFRGEQDSWKSGRLQLD